MSDLFQSNAAKNEDLQSYSAKDIEVLEGLEPVRKRPGMYIGGTDEKALHHLVSEVFDNSMDEAVAGHASRIEIELHADGSITVTDNGRGIPIDKHPKYPDKSALEVILTTLHSGGKFSNKAYETSGGLHGVGISVVNALTDHLVVEVARDKTLYRQTYSRGTPQTKLENLGPVSNRRGTAITFHPDAQIFGNKAKFKPQHLYEMARSKAYLYKGVEIRWSCDSSLIEPESGLPTEEIFKFPNGLLDYLESALENRPPITPKAFYGSVDFAGNEGRAEFAIQWPEDGRGFINSYCNTIPTAQGGTHEAGLRTALSRSIKNYGEMVGNKKASNITAEDVTVGACILLSIFIREPQFQGQTKEKLTNASVTRWVDNAVKDYFDHWLTSDPVSAARLLEAVIDRAEERLRRRDNRDMARKSATQKLRLPGKLADCSRNSAEDTEIFIVEGDSAGGSAKQARNRETQAILPLRGKILNVASATHDKIHANQEIQNLVMALGSGIGKDFSLDNLRYERVIIMTDADVDGAHIASLLITFFYQKMRGLIEHGHLYLALPPLYRVTAGGEHIYVQDDAEKDALLEGKFKNRKVEVGRFKGLGEMMPKQLKETTMDPKKRTLVRITIESTQNPDSDFSKHASERTELLVADLMGKNADARFRFIQEHAEFAKEIDV